MANNRCRYFCDAPFLVAGRPVTPAGRVMKFNKKETD